MVGEALAGLSALKTAFDLAKGLKDIDDRTRLNAAVIELQEKILGAQQSQPDLIAQVSALEKEVTELKAWDAEKKRYQRRELGPGVIGFVLKPEEQKGETPHVLCPKCFHDGKPSEIQATQALRMRRRVHYCPRCKSEYEFGALNIQEKPAQAITDYDVFTGR